MCESFVARIKSSNTFDLQTKSKNTARDFPDEAVYTNFHLKMIFSVREKIEENRGDFALSLKLLFHPTTPHRCDQKFFAQKIFKILQNGQSENFSGLYPARNRRNLSWMVFLLNFPNLHSTFLCFRVAEHHCQAWVTICVFAQDNRLALASILAHPLYTLIWLDIIIYLIIVIYSSWLMTQGIKCVSLY